MERKDVYQQNVFDLVKAVKDWGSGILEIIAEYELDPEEERFFDSLKGIAKNLENIGTELEKRLKRIGNIRGLRKELIPFDERHAEYYKKKGV